MVKPIRWSRCCSADLRAGLRAVAEQAAKFGLVGADPRRCPLGAWDRRSSAARPASSRSPGKDEGAWRPTGGQAHDNGTGKGYCIEPTVFSDVDNLTADRSRGDLGPVLCDPSTMRQRRSPSPTLRCGLAAAVWTRDRRPRLRGAQGRRRHGLVNAYNLYDPSLPLAASRRAVAGRPWEAALAGYTESKSVWTTPAERMNELKRPEAPKRGDLEQARPAPAAIARPAQRRR